MNETLVPLASLVERHPRAAVGAIELGRVRGRWHLGPTDAQIVDPSDAMHAAGFTEELGFEPGVTRFHVTAAQRLAAEEVSHFQQTRHNRLDPARTATLVAAFAADSAAAADSTMLRDGAKPKEAGR